MADQSDVENGLVAQCATALGLGTGYMPGALVAGPGGVLTKVYRGWPTDTALYKDMLAGYAHVSVYPEPGLTRNTTRFPTYYHQQPVVSPTLTATVAGAVLTIGGTVTVGNVVGVQFGPATATAAYAVAAVNGSTLATLATALSAKIVGATASGATVTLPSSTNAVGAVMAQQTAIVELRRQEQAFRISTWCPTPAIRDSIASTVDAGLAGMTDAYGHLTEFMPLANGDVARIRWRNVYNNDIVSRDRVWRRDLCYVAEYPTTLTISAGRALWIGGPLWKAGVLDQWGVMEPSNALETSVDGQSVYIDAAGNLVGAPPTS